MTGSQASACTFSPRAGSQTRRPYVVIDDSICGAGDGYPHRLHGLLTAALRLTPPDRVVLTAQESKSPWWSPLTARLGIRVLTLPIERGLGVHLAVGALQLCRVAPMARAIFVTGPLQSATVEGLARGPSFGPRPHRVAGPDRSPTVVLSSAASFAAHVAAANPDGFELLLFSVACSTDQQRLDLLDSTFPYLEHLDDARWLHPLPQAQLVPKPPAANDLAPAPRSTRLRPRAQGRDVGGKPPQDLPERV